MEALSTSFSIVSFFAPKSLFCVDNFSVLFNITLNIFSLFTQMCQIQNLPSAGNWSDMWHETSCSLVPGLGWTHRMVLLKNACFTIPGRERLFQSLIPRWFGQWLGWIWWKYDFLKIHFWFCFSLEGHLLWSIIL